MALPTYADLLPGTTVVDDPSDFPATVNPSEPYILIPYSAFTGTSLSEIASLQNPEKLITAILQKAEPWYRADGTEQPSLGFDAVRVSYDTDRNGSPAFAFAFGVTAYQSTVSPSLDIDTIKSGV